MLIRLAGNTIINSDHIAYCVVTKNADNIVGIDFTLINGKNWRLNTDGSTEAERIMCLLEKPATISDILQ